ncbi:MAG TPA: hypothetical protein VFI65_27855 [Streptosporangiaceae bacterium]|nr:hypothetical protein [Streptosporangiaceae bacterium]
MALEIGLVVALVLLCAGAIVIWTRLAAANARRIETPAGDLQDLFWGDVMCRHVITSGGMARLEFFDWGVRLRGTFLSRWIVPTWEARYDELSTAGLASLPHSRVAVWLRLKNESAVLAEGGRPPGTPAVLVEGGRPPGTPAGIGFLCDRYTQVLPVLEGHGVQVDRSVTRARKVEELYK